MDEMEFTEAKSIMTELVADYREAATEGQQPESFEEEEDC
jgi:hypothetical protein